MRTPSSIALLALVVFPLIAGSASAQSAPPAAPAASATSAQAPPPPPYREGTAEFAFVGTTGNASAQTIGLAFGLILRPDGWVVTNRASYLRNESEGETTANALLYGFRAEHTLTPRLSAFGEYGYFRDEFAGVSHRNTVVGGVTYKLVDTARHLLAVDGGLGYLNEQRLVPPDVSTGVYAFGGAYKLKLSETAEITEDVRFTGTFAEADDWRVANVLALSARLTTLLSLKVSNNVRYANRPVEGFKKTDTSTAVALVAKF